MVHSRLVESFLAHAKKAPSLSFWWMPRKCYQFVEFLVVVEKMLPVGWVFGQKLPWVIDFGELFFPWVFTKVVKKSLSYLLPKVQYENNSLLSPCVWVSQSPVCHLQPLPVWLPVVGICRLEVADRVGSASGLLNGPDDQQFWSLTQFYSVDFSRFDVRF